MLGFFAICLGVAVRILPLAVDGGVHVGRGPRPLDHSGLAVNRIKFVIMTMMVAAIRILWNRTRQLTVVFHGDDLADLRLLSIPQLSSILFQSPPDIRMNDVVFSASLLTQLRLFRLKARDRGKFTVLLSEIIFLEEGNTLGFAVLVYSCCPVYGMAFGERL